MHLPLFAVGKQLVEDKRIDISSASPQDHEDNDLQLVQADGFIGQGHRPFDDQFSQ
jgi:hypothetical protein